MKILSMAFTFLLGCGLLSCSKFIFLGDCSKDENACREPICILQREMVTKLGRIKSLSFSSDEKIVFAAFYNRSKIKQFPLKPGGRANLFGDFKTDIADIHIYNGILSVSTINHRITQWSKSLLVKSIVLKSTARQLLQKKEQYFFSHYDQVSMWDPFIKERKLYKHGSSIVRIVLRNNILASCSLNNVVKLYSITSNKILLSITSEKTITDISLSSDGKVLVISSLGGEVSFWDTSSLRKKGIYSSSESSFVRIIGHPKRNFSLLVSKNGRLHFLNINEEKEYYISSVSIKNATSFSFSESGSYLGIGFNGKVQVWKCD